MMLKFLSWLFLGIAIVLAMGGCSGAPDGDYEPTELVGGFKLMQTSADQVNIAEDPQYGDSPEIPAKVTAVAVIGKTIVAKQLTLKPDRLGAAGEERLWVLDTGSRTLDGPMSQAECDELVKARLKQDVVLFTDAHDILRAERDRRIGKRGPP